MGCSSRGVKISVYLLPALLHILMLLVALRNKAIPYPRTTTNISTTVSAFQITTATTLVSKRKFSLRNTQTIISTGCNTIKPRTKTTATTTTAKVKLQSSYLQQPYSELKSSSFHKSIISTPSRNMHSSTSTLLCATQSGPSVETTPPNNDDDHEDTQTNGVTSSDTTTTNNSDYGIDMDQNTLMETDMLVAVDEQDHLVPNVVLSKKLGHTFNIHTPRATLHRAFSFFIFNSNQELLLTQRAASKITFPNVWTNTVCSHPLYGMNPNEADVVPDAYPNFPGIKHAAIRKCLHELGIPPSCLDPNQIRFITRFHYWAADTITYGNTESCPWGEHEVDYILFYQLPPPPTTTSSTSDEIGIITPTATATATATATLPISPNPEEVSDYKYVSIDELRNNMFHDPSLLWSPWFRGIMDRGGFEWWTHLDQAMAGTYTNDQITYFDPPSYHMATYNTPSHTKLTGVLSSQSKSSTSTTTTTSTTSNGNSNGSK